MNGGGPKFRIVQGKQLGDRSTPTAPIRINTPEPNSQQPQHVIKQEQDLGIDGYSISERPMDSHQMNADPSMHVKIEDPMSPPHMINGAPQSSQHVPIPRQMPQMQIAPGQQMMPVQQMNSSQPPMRYSTTPPPQPSSQQQIGDGGGRGGSTDDRNVIKCVRFLKTLINLSNNDDPEQPDKAMEVRNLIQGVVYNETPAEEFTGNLQQVLKSQAQPHLLPFLQNTLPALRAAVRNGEASVDGVDPPPGYVFSNGKVPPIQQPQMTMDMRQMPQPGGHPSQQIINRLNADPQMQRPPMIQRPGPMHLQPRSMNGPMQMAPQIPVNQQQMQIQHHPPPNHSQHPQQHMHQSQNDSRMEVDEPQRIKVGTEGSLKGSIIKPDEVLSRITKRMQLSCSVEEEALLAISDAVESHIREMITYMATIAEHRVESMRVSENYVAVDDVKRQLRFLEDVDRQEEELRENREKESLIRMSKNKNSGKETIEKAKEMQRADAEAKRNRDANAAAIAALSSNRTVKNKWEGSTTSSTAPRPRTVRVTARDLQMMVNTDNRFRGTFIRERLSYAGPATDTTI